MHSKLKSTTLVFALAALILGLAACAKYPAVANAPGSMPSAAAPAPVPPR